MIEPVVFWLDVKHFKHFDGNQDDLAVYAANIGRENHILDV
jgi:hypothetical protein